MPYEVYTRLEFRGKGSVTFQIEPGEQLEIVDGPFNDLTVDVRVVASGFTFNIDRDCLVPYRG